jgi:hypothetical protein
MSKLYFSLKDLYDIKPKLAKIYFTLIKNPKDIKTTLFSVYMMIQYYTFKNIRMNNVVKRPYNASKDRAFLNCILKQKRFSQQEMIEYSENLALMDYIEERMKEQKDAVTKLENSVDLKTNTLHIMLVDNTNKNKKYAIKHIIQEITHGDIAVIYYDRTVKLICHSSAVNKENVIKAMNISCDYLKDFTVEEILNAMKDRLTIDSVDFSFLNNYISLCVYE